MKAGLMGASLMVALVGCSSQHAELQIRPIGGQQAQSGDAALAKAELLLSRGEYSLAIDAYRKAMRHDPASAAAHNGLAVSYDQLGRHDLSRRYYELALARAPREAKYYRNLARSLERQGRADEAKGVLAQMQADGEGGANGALVPSVGPARRLVDLAKDGFADAASVVASVIGPHLNRLSMGEVFLSTREKKATRTPGQSITIPIPPVSNGPAKIEIASHPVGHSITVAIPSAEPVSAPEAGPDHRSRLADIPVATLESAQPAVVRTDDKQGILLASAAVDGAELLAMALHPVAVTAPALAPELTLGCRTPAPAPFAMEYDVAPAASAIMLVFTGDFAAMRLGTTGYAIDLPILYPASSNLPREVQMASAIMAGTECGVRMADVPALFNSSLSSLLAERDHRL